MFKAGLEPWSFLPTKSPAGWRRWRSWRRSNRRDPSVVRLVGDSTAASTPPVRRAPPPWPPGTTATRRWICPTSWPASPTGLPQPRQVGVTLILWLDGRSSHSSTTKYYCLLFSLTFKVLHWFDLNLKWFMGNWVVRSNELTTSQLFRPGTW